MLEKCPVRILEACGYRGECPKSVLELIDACAVNDMECERMMRAFATSIGKGYRAEQLALCDYYIGLLESRRRTAAEQLPLKIKRNSAICLCGALAVVILFI